MGFKLLVIINICLVHTHVQYFNVSLYLSGVAGSHCRHDHTYSEYGIFKKHQLTLAQYPQGPDLDWTCNIHSMTMVHGTRWQGYIIWSIIWFIEHQCLEHQCLVCFVFCFFFFYHLFAYFWFDMKAEKYKNSHSWHDLICLFCLTGPLEPMLLPLIIKLNRQWWVILFNNWSCMSFSKSVIFVILVIPFMSVFDLFAFLKYMSVCFKALTHWTHS